MASYNVKLLRRAEKELRKIAPKDIKRIASKIDGLVDEPRPRQSKKLVGSNSGYRLRAGNYRILYTIDEGKKKVVIYRIATRQSVY